MVSGNGQKDRLLTADWKAQQWNYSLISVSGICLILSCNHLEINSLTQAGKAVCGSIKVNTPQDK